MQPTGNPVVTLVGCAMKNHNFAPFLGRALTLLTIPMFFCIPATQAACNAGPVALQILGSGGPFGNGRASSGYLIWIDGLAQIMVDAGGGTFTRFHAAGARVGDLELLALTHFHPDHAAEIPALLWIKPTDMRISGPSGSSGYPSANEYVNGLFGTDGVFRAVTNGKGMNTITIDVESGEPTDVFSNEAVNVRALGVPHGIVPAVGYRIDIGATSIAFSSDQNGTDPNFIEFVKDVDVLVVHVAIPEDEQGFGADLHAKPSVWGQIATDANAGMLILSHLSGIRPQQANGELFGFDEKLKLIRSRYDGDLVIAEDLMCIPIGTRGN